MLPYDMQETARICIVEVHSSELIKTVQSISYCCGRRRVCALSLAGQSSRDRETLLCGIACVDPEDVPVLPHMMTGVPVDFNAKSVLPDADVP